MTSLAEIFRAHQAMLDGLLAAREFEKELNESLQGAAEAVRAVFRRWEARFAALEVETFRQRADDIVDLAQRVLRQLEGVDASDLNAMASGSVLVAQRLLPSDVIALRRDVAAIPSQTNLERENATCHSTVGSGTSAPPSRLARAIAGDPGDPRRIDPTSKYWKTARFPAATSRPTWSVTSPAARTSPTPT